MKKIINFIKHKHLQKSFLAVCLSIVVLAVVSTYNVTSSQTFGSPEISLASVSPQGENKGSVIAASCGFGDGSGHSIGDTTCGGTCPFGSQPMNGVCLSTCANGATNFPACNICPAGQVVVDSICQNQVWTNYCTGANDPNGNFWQVWQYDNSNPVQYRSTFTFCDPPTDPECSAPKYYSCQYYRSANPDVVASPYGATCGTTYAHYLTFGQNENRTPNPICTQCTNGATNSPTCSTCLPGQGWNGSRCVACGATQITVNNSCSTCPAGTTPDPSRTSCVNTCLPGQGWNGSRCVACGATQITVNNSCSTCPAGTTPDPSRTSCVNTCLPGQGWNGSRCVACGATQITVNNSCSTCPAGTTPDPSRTSCVSTCTNGAINPPQCTSCQTPQYYFNGTSCIPNPCGSVVPPANYGQSCAGPNNACGQPSSGTIRCDATCSAVTPNNNGCIQTFTPNTTSIQPNGSVEFFYKLLPSCLWHI
jgi:hypothetical protein